MRKKFALRVAGGADPVEEFIVRFKAELAPLLESQRDAMANPNRLCLNAVTYGVEEITEALESLISTRVTMGTKVSKFERAFARYLGTKHAIMVNSGSSANLLIFSALANPVSKRLAPGDEVLVPAVTWSTSIWPIIQVGAVPVLVDIEPRTLAIDPAEAKRAISNRTKAIFVTHTLGNSANMDSIGALAKNNGLTVLEDCCEALGTRYRGRPVGNDSLAASFSFFFSHHITTIEGGMVVTNDDALADLLRCLRAHGWSRDMRNRGEIEKTNPEIDPKFLFVNVGYNLRPTEIQGAFGLHQLVKLDELNAKRKIVASWFREALEPFGDVLTCTEATEGADHTWFGFPVMLSQRHSTQRRRLSDFLEARGIENRPIISGNLARQPALKLFRHRLSGSLPNAQAVTERGIYWGVDPHTTERQVEYLASQLHEYFRADMKSRRAVG